MFILQISSKEIDKNLLKIADLSDHKRGKIVGARMAGTRVTKTAELFGVARSAVLKVMTAFEKEGKNHRRQTLEESESCLIGTIGLLYGLLERITRIQLQKLLQNLMTSSRTQFP